MTPWTFTAKDDNSGCAAAAVLEQTNTTEDLLPLTCGQESNLVRLILALVATGSAAALRSRLRRNTGNRRSLGTA